MEKNWLKICREDTAPIYKFLKKKLKERGINYKRCKNDFE